MLIILNIGGHIEKHLNNIPNFLYGSISKCYLLVDKTVLFIVGNA